MGLQALIGYTGFVGQNLTEQRDFDGLFNRQNLMDLPGTIWDRLVICGLPAEKWRANQDPDADLANMRRLQQALDGVRARQVILISTVDVYPQPLDVDEATAIDIGAQAPYGRHRHAFERWAGSRFGDCRILRLPGLFGPGLKKNVLFDLLHDHQIELIDGNSRFQWYPVRRLAEDIDRLVACNLQVVNAGTAPVRTADLVRAFFPWHVGRIRMNEESAAPSYRMRSRHSAAFGGEGGFWMTQAAVKAAIAAWLAGETAWKDAHGG
jgi:nucleoside-diphosphate-sugar epimerase